MRRKKSALGLDDWTMFAAWLLATILITLNCLSARYGIGLHIWDIPNRETHGPTLQKLSLAWQVVIGPFIGLTKLSICFTYLRLFPFRTNTIFCYCTMAVVTSWTLAMFFGQLFQCLPMSQNWAYLNSQKQCIHQESFAIATAVLNNVTDFLVFLWPAKYIWNVQLPRNRSMALLLSFTVGILVCVAGAFSIWTIMIHHSTYDIPWVGAVTYIVTAVEVTLGIVCRCIPPTRPLFSRLLSWTGIRSSKALSSGGSSGAKNFVQSLRLKRSVEDDMESTTEIALTDIRQDIEVSSDVSDVLDVAPHTADGREGDEVVDNRTRGRSTVGKPTRH